MNFLLHRQFAIAELGSRDAGVGAMLPDLWRMADRAMKAREHVIVDGSSVQTGVQHHLDADAWFHRTLVFTRGERWLSRELVQVGARKLVLFAHATWEMCLDGALLLEGDFQTQLEELRHDIAQASASFEAVARAHGASELPHQAQFRARFERLIDGVVDGRWIASYQQGDGLAQCVAGMRRRFSLPPLTDEQESLTACILEQALEQASEALPELRDARRRHLAEAAA